MLVRLLAWVLLQALAMGLLNALFARRAPFPHVAFCAASGVSCAILGMALLGAPLVDHARLAAWTGLWIPAFALGAFASGIVAAVAWLGTVLGGGWWLRRRFGR